VPGVVAGFSPNHSEDIRHSFRPKKGASCGVSVSPSQDPALAFGFLREKVGKIKH